MRKFIIILPIFLFLSITTNTIMIMAQPNSYSEGFYTIKDLGLMENIKYNVQNISPNSQALLLIYDSEQRLKESVRLMPNTPKYALLPISYSDKIIIIGNGNLKFST